MYAPKYNQEKDWQNVAAFIREHSFGLLISTRDGVPEGTHIPMELEEKAPGEFVITGHISKANLQWQSFTSDQTFLAIFTSPHAYISGSWYEEDRVPTWNYMAVHVYGKIRVLNNDEMDALLENLVNRYEHGRPNRVHVQDIDAGEMASMKKAIVGFELSITGVHTRFKLSQNRHRADYQHVIDHLKEQGDEQAAFIANEMEKREKPTH
ncbi:PaiB family negative transcriptional regulator [Chitinophaga skermanii]|uniref:PaiB family negative transcriptional regulator n=1 Tax=Chitinophaga skermanii TaxID=331697 RepID=A0A327Q9F8_9BACT|nr:FMN-binding negative transcriptional regulator [Chitinophaga skermanii]RAJ00332.1 PaiB family negative transcriptional regulator [Chitinophaga skermanii]